MTDRIRTDFSRVVREIEHTWIPPGVSENGGRIFSRDWTFTIPRDHV